MIHKRKKLYFDKIKKLLFFERHCEEMKGKPQTERKIFAKHIPNKELKNS